MNTTKLAASMGIRYEGTSSEIWLVQEGPARNFVARFKYAKPGTRATQFLKALQAKFGPGPAGVDAYLIAREEAQKASPTGGSPLQVVGLA